MCTHWECILRLTTHCTWATKLWKPILSLAPPNNNLFHFQFAHISLSWLFWQLFKFSGIFTFGNRKLSEPDLCLCRFWLWWMTLLPSLQSFVLKIILCVPFAFCSVQIFDYVLFLNMIWSLNKSILLLKRWSCVVACGLNVNYWRSKLHLRWDFPYCEQTYGGRFFGSNQEEKTLLWCHWLFQ